MDYEALRHFDCAQCGQVQGIIRLRESKIRYLIMGPTGFDSETNWIVSMPSAGI